MGAGGNCRLAPFSFFFFVTVLCTTTAIALADSAAVCALSAFAQCVCVFLRPLWCFAVISDLKSPVVVRWLPHRGRRCVGASLVELSRKTHFSVAMSWFCVISKHKSTTRVCQLRHLRRRCSEASLVELSHKTHFSVAMSSLCVKPQTPREMDEKHGNSSARAALCL